MERTRLSVMTYNVHSCIGRDCRLAFERVAEVIAMFGCDLVALQEIDIELPRSGGVHQAQEIAAILQMHYHFLPVLWFEKGQYGNALLSRFPLTVLRAGPLPTLPGRKKMERRGALWAEIHVGVGRVQMLSTHLGLNRLERRMQIDALLGPEWLGSPALRPPMILCGDFNTFPAFYVYRRLSRLFKDAQRLGAPAVKATYPSRWPLLRLDYVFVSEDIVVRKTFVPRMPLTRMASDHLPVIAELDIPLR